MELIKLKLDNFITTKPVLYLVRPSLGLQGYLAHKNSVIGPHSGYGGGGGFL